MLPSFESVVVVAHSKGNGLSFTTLMQDHYQDVGAVQRFLRGQGAAVCLRHKSSSSLQEVDVPARNVWEALKLLEFLNDSIQDEAKIRGSGRLFLGV